MAMPPNANSPDIGPDPDDRNAGKPGGQDSQPHGGPDTQGPQQYPAPSDEAGFSQRGQHPENEPSDRAPLYPSPGQNPHRPPGSYFSAIPQEPPPSADYPGWPTQRPPPPGQTGLIVGVAVAVAVLLVGGIGLVAINMLRDAGTGIVVSRESPSEIETPTELDAADPDTVDSPDEDVGQRIFGDTFTYDDGVSISVDPPVSFSPSEFALFDEAPSYVRFTITLVNDGTDSFDASGIYASAQSGESEAIYVYDSEQGLEGPPYTSLLPDRTVSWDVGFGVDDPEDVVLQISPSWDHEAAIFVSG